MRYMITHSLLSAWLYAIRDNPYEDATTERDPMAEFLQTLRREPSVPTEAMLNGIAFEGIVDALACGMQPTDPHTEAWYDAALKIAQCVKGGVRQYAAKKTVLVRGMTFLLYGRLDWLKAGTILDIKFSKGYEVGKYIASTQHPMYFELVPEAKVFTYKVSNGQYVWTETYRREETPSIYPILSDFLDYLDTHGLMNLYKEKWQAL